MPPVKWERLQVRDTGGTGGSQDILADGGPGILNLQNGAFGPDGTPYPLKVGLRPPSTITIGDALGGSLGPGGFIYTGLGNDTNGNSSRVKYILTHTKQYAVFKGTPVGLQFNAMVASPGNAGLNIGFFSSFDLLFGTNDVTVFNQPGIASSVGGVGGAPTPPCLICCGGFNSDPTVHAEVQNAGVFGYPVNDASVVAVVANRSVQPISATMGNGNVGFFALFRNATNWYLTKTTADIIGAFVATTFQVDPPPEAGFNTTNVERYQIWGQYDTAGGVNATLDVHASGTAGAYAGSQAADFFQGRLVMGNMLWYPKYAVAGDRDTYVFKPNRLVWTILPGEKPSRGPYTTNSFGLTHMQWPWSIEVNNFTDVDGVGKILQLVNMGDNQLVIMGDRGIARLTGYLSTAVAGVNSATFDVRPVMGAPGLRYPGAAVLTKNGIYYVGKNSIYLYDGNSVRDVLYGSIKANFNTSVNVTEFWPVGGLDNSIYFGTAASAGFIDDDYVYFSCVAQGAGIHFLLNINTGKWSTIGQSATGNNSGFTRSVKRNAAAVEQIAAPTTNNTIGLISLPSQSLQVPLQRTSLASGGINTTTNDIWQPVGATTSPDAYYIALRMAGSTGIPKRFINAIFNYGFTAQVGTPVCRIKYVYGHGRGWPYVGSGGTQPVLLGTLPLIGVVNTNDGGDLPNASVRLNFNEGTLVNPSQLASPAITWPDSITFIVEVDWSGGLGSFILHSVDLSYIERGVGHAVMGAA